jgi:hypothetical protein
MSSGASLTRLPDQASDLDPAWVERHIQFAQANCVGAFSYVNTMLNRTVRGRRQEAKKQQLALSADGQVNGSEVGTPGGQSLIGGQWTSA